MNDKTYDTLKTIALLVLPIGTFIATVMNIWGIGYAEQVQQSFIALDVLCGVVVTVAKAEYDKRANT